jgi:hypothetical protein
MLFLADFGRVTARQRVVQGYSLAGRKYRPTEAEFVVVFVAYRKVLPLAGDLGRFKQSSGEDENEKSIGPG